MTNLNTDLDSLWLDYLISVVLHFGVFLLEDHPEGSQRHQQTVTHVPKHHSKQEGERDDGVHRCTHIDREDVTQVTEKYTCYSEHSPLLSGVGPYPD